MTPIPAPNGESQTREQSEVGSDSLLTPEMRAIIHGSEGKDKKAEYEASLKRWWTEYADRKNDEDDEYVANSLLLTSRNLVIANKQRITNEAQNVTKIVSENLTKNETNVKDSSSGMMGWLEQRSKQEEPQVAKLETKVS